MDYDIDDPLCYDCQQDKDNCPDCCDHDKYVSPDSYPEQDR